MPPKGLPKPTAEQLSALTNYVEGEFEKADRGGETRSWPGDCAAAEPR